MNAAVEALTDLRTAVVRAVRQTRRTMRPTPKRIKAKAWNVHVGSNPAARVRSLRNELRAEPSDVLALSEAGGIFRELRRELGDEWRLWRGARGKDATVLGIRRDLRVPRHQIVAHSIPWIGPKAFRRHIGRAFPWGDIGRGKDEHKHRVMADHRTPGGPTGGVKTRGRNRPAWQKEDQLLERFAMRRGSRRRAFAIIGDQNCHPNDGHPLGIRSLARRIGGEVLAPPNTPVDSAIIRDYEGACRRGPKMGSDHPLVTYVLRDDR